MAVSPGASGNLCHRSGHPDLRAKTSPHFWRGKALIKSAQVLAVVVVVLLGIVVPPDPAEASQGGQPSSTGDQCAIRIDADRDVTQSSAPVCFESVSEVESYVEESISAESDGSGSRISTVLGVVYQDANYGGASLTMYGSGTCSGTTYGFPSLASGWDNSISSAKGSSTCWLTLYSATYYGGSRLNCVPNCGSLGTMNDQVKSIVFRPVGTYGRS